jgi:hypothetical protein
MEYQSGMLGKAPQTNNTYQANMNDPFAAAIGGGMQGFGFANKYMPRGGQSSLVPQNSPMPRFRGGF